MPGHALPFSPPPGRSFLRGTPHTTFSPFYLTTTFRPMLDGHSSPFKRQLFKTWARTFTTHHIHTHACCCPLLCCDTTPRSGTCLCLHANAPTRRSPPSPLLTTPASLQRRCSTCLPPTTISVSSHHLFAALLLYRMRSVFTCRDARQRAWANRLLRTGAARLATGIALSIHCVVITCAVTWRFSSALRLCYLSFELTLGTDSRVRTAGERFSFAP